MKFLDWCLFFVAFYYGILTRVNIKMAPSDGYAPPTTGSKPAALLLRHEGF